MKIVHLTWGLGVGGMETMLRDIAVEQAATHQVCIVVGNREVDPDVVGGFGSDVNLVRLDRPAGSSNPWYGLKLLRHVRRLRPDAIHAHHESFHRFRMFFPAPMLFTVHNTRRSLDGLDSQDSICCISEAVRLDVTARYPGCTPRVIHNGIDFGAVRRKRCYGGSPLRVVQVSRLAHEQKGQDLLIRALPALLTHLGPNGVRVEFIGAGASLDYLRHLAAECGVGHCCRFDGALSRRAIYERLMEYDVLVQPSRYEGFGLTILEGIAAGLPVLVSDIEGPNEIVAGGELGWSFRSEDAADLSAKLLEIAVMSRQPGFAERMRHRAETARGRFDIKTTARRYLHEYARLTVRRRASGSMHRMSDEGRWP